MNDANTNSGASAAALAESGGSVPMEKIIVAIHGVGSQLRSSISELNNDAKVRALLTVVTFIVAFIAGWIVPRRPKLSRWTLLGSGTLAVAAIVIGRLGEMENAPPVWSIVLAGLLFLCLWWLGILMFDLTFVWHRYVREAVYVQVLRSWSRHEDAKPRPLMGFGPDRSALQNRPVRRRGAARKAKA